MSAELALAVADERLGLPSASSMERIAACAGSLALINTTGSKGESSPDADRGTAIHAELETWAKGGRKTIAGLSSDAQQCAVQIENALAVFGNPTVNSELIETRFHIRKGLRSVCTGKADLVLVSGTTAFVFDYKTGRNPVAMPEHNKQLQVLCLAVADDLGMDNVVGVLIQPAVWQMPKHTTFTQSDLTYLRRRLMDALDAAGMPDAPRVAGDHCGYCPAKLRCPQYSQRIALSSPIGELTAETIPAWLDACETAGKIIESVKDRAKAIALAGGEIAGWKLVGGGSTNSIDDVQAAYSAVSSVLTAEQFRAACSVSFADLVKQHAAANPALTKKEAEAILETFLGTLLVKKERSASLRRSARAA